MTAIAAASLLWLSACGGGGGSDGAAAPETGGGNAVLTGQVYPVVAGLSYRTASQKGVVGADGSFQYKAGEQVTLSLAGVDLITARAAPRMSALDLDDDEQATLALRLYRTLDSDSNLANGAQISPMPPTNVTTIDATDAAAVANLAAQVKPGATLASADAQVTTALASTKATAAAAMPPSGANYQGVYRAWSGDCPVVSPTNASLQLSGQPNWTTGALTGTLAVTLSNATVQAVPLTQATGTFATPGGSYEYRLTPKPNGVRVISVAFHPVFTDARCHSENAMRDPAQANVPPVAAISKGLLSIGLTPGAADTYTYETVKGGALGIFQGSRDFDGRVVAVEWKSSKNKTSTDLSFTETVAPGEEVTMTLTVTDDEGAKGVNTWTLSRKPMTVDQALTLLGTRTWKYDTPEDGYVYYYRLSADKSTFTEYEVPVGGNTCSVSATFPASGVTAGLDTSKLVFTGNARFSYTDASGERSSFTQATAIPGGC